MDPGLDERDVQCLMRTYVPATSLAGRIPADPAGMAIATDDVLLPHEAAWEQQMRELRAKDRIATGPDGITHALRTLAFTPQTAALRTVLVASVKSRRKGPDGKPLLLADSTIETILKPMRSWCTGQATREGAPSCITRRGDLRVPKRET